MKQIFRTKQVWYAIAFYKYVVHVSSQIVKIHWLKVTQTMVLGVGIMNININNRVQLKQFRLVAKI